ncbi:Toxin RTX-I translocation ATP-binding protein [Aquimixticola soesokkakensis]|uniref:Toxin RTX-I translocation ATP-binding protein n=1 Tax=Aquimixticola soesokkakensis TaxID=1519096 RepID=A0A1Y5TQ45_9RHOB|nr:ABC transporter transmembrane domain-containing protein [Aquimixticola soesokkakensis]SLN69377.1 Toxin RTX-I translocation ATP-binding protein [Aquimixticola soesokkakensis]
MIQQARAEIPRLPLIAATISIVIFELIIPLTVQQVYDRFIPNQSLSSLNVLVAIALLCLCAEAFLRWARSVLLGLQGASFAHRAGCQVMGSLLSGRIETAQKQGVGGKLALLNLVRSYREEGSGQRIIVLAEIVIIPLTLGLIAMIAGRLVLVPLGLILLFVIYTLIAGSALFDAKQRRQSSDASRIDLMVEILGATQTIKALSVERNMVGLYEQKKYASSLDHLEVSRRQTFLFDLTNSFSTLLIFSVILFGAYLTVEGNITVGAMIASIILSGRAMPPLQKALGMLNRRQEHQVEAKQVEALLSVVPATNALPRDECPENMGLFALSALTLHHEHQTADHPLLIDSATLDFPRFEMSVLQGAPHGALTRVFRAFSGLHSADSGAVLLNGQPITTLPESVRTRQVAYLKSDTTLYRGTIMDNLSRFGMIPTSDVLFIAKQLRLDEDLSVLSRGFDTFLRGDGGDPVPPGMRQRLALARALAPRPKVILFNHADTGLDRRSYTALFELFARLRGHATVVLASNDNTLCGLAQHRYTLDAGHLRAERMQETQKLAVTSYRELRV